MPACAVAPTEYLSTAGSVTRKYTPIQRRPVSLRTLDVGLSARRGYPYDGADQLYRGVSEEP